MVGIFHSQLTWYEAHYLLMGSECFLFSGRLAPHCACAALICYPFKCIDVGPSPETRAASQGHLPNSHQLPITAQLGVVELREPLSHPC